MGRAAKVAWVHTHVGTKGQARRLIALVLDARVAACANAWPIDSAYWWDGKLHRTREVSIVFKTAPKRLPALREAVRRAHPYRVPFLAWGRDERVLPAYARWATGATAARRARGAHSSQGRARRRTRRGT